MSTVSTVSKSGLMAWAHRVARNEATVCGVKYSDAFARAMTKAHSMVCQGYSFTAFAFEIIEPRRLRG